MSERIDVMPNIRKATETVNRIKLHTIDLKVQGAIQDFVHSNLKKEWLLFGTDFIIVIRESEKQLTEEEQRDLVGRQVQAIEEYLSTEANVFAKSEKTKEFQYEELSKESSKPDYWSNNLGKERNETIFPIVALTSNCKRDLINDKAILKLCSACVEKSKFFFINKDVKLYSSYIEDRLSHLNMSFVEFLFFRRLFSLLRVHSLLVIGKHSVFKTEAARCAGVETKVSICTSEKSEHYLRKVINEKVDCLQLPSEDFEGSFDFAIIDEESFEIDSIDFLDKARNSVRPGGMLLICKFKSPENKKNADISTADQSYADFEKIPIANWGIHNRCQFDLFMKCGGSP